MLKFAKSKKTQVREMEKEKHAMLSSSNYELVGYTAYKKLSHALGGKICSRTIYIIECRTYIVLLIYQDLSMSSIPTPTPECSEILFSACVSR